MDRWTVAVGLSLLSFSAFAQVDEVKKADALFQNGNRQQALPLYEELVEANPKKPLYAERLAICLYSQSAGLETGPGRTALLERIEAEARNAVALGSRDDAMQVIANFDLSLMSDEKGESLAKAIWRSGEPYFGSGDFKEALRRYATAAELEPKVYEPALFAGDAAQLIGDMPTAAQWYGKAASINPNFPKTYLHWGDAIERITHDSGAAKAKYIDAMVANPYDPQGRQGLEKWAEEHGAVLAPPQIKPPSGGMEMFKALGHDASSQTPWATYVLDEFAYESNAKNSPIGTFREDHPGETKVQRSLIEEYKAIHAVALEVEAKKGEKPSQEFHDLIEVD